MSADQNQDNEMNTPEESDTNEVIQSPAEALEALKARADLMGVKYHPSISFAKLSDKIAEHLSDNPPEDEKTQGVSDEPAAPVEAKPETENQKRSRLKREALALVRIRVTCMNPAKKEWEGELFTGGNSFIGSVTKFVPFNNDEGWHVPKIILNIMQSRQCQIFTTVRNHLGQAQRKSKMIKEFAIEVMDPLTPAELAELARRQAATKAID